MQDLIEKQFTYLGNTETLYFRELSAAEALKIGSGATGVMRNGVMEIAVDPDQHFERGIQLLAASLVTEDGKQVFANGSASRAREMKNSRLSAMVTLAREAKAEFDKRATQPGEG